jgi:hypothetical protein
VNLQPQVSEILEIFSRNPINHKASSRISEFLLYGIFFSLIPAPGRISRRHKISHDINYQRRGSGKISRREKDDREDEFSEFLTPHTENVCFVDTADTPRIYSQHTRSVRMEEKCLKVSFYP